jgi:tripartite-type tricarboxylate transporter receptor subunit TctC
MIEHPCLRSCARIEFEDARSRTLLRYALTLMPSMRRYLVPWLFFSCVAAGQVAKTTLVVPFPEGGEADFVARQIAEALPRALGEPVGIAHRSGEDGLSGVNEVLRAPADGRTLLMGSTASVVFAPMAQGRPPFDPTEDFTPIAIVGTISRLVLAHPSLPANNLDQLIRLARETPGALTCGTADQVSQQAARLFERHAGVRLDCVAYPGGAALREDLLAGKRKVAFENVFLPEVQAGRLRALAIAGPGRMRVLPDVPTASESGLPGLEAVTWLAVLAPKGVDRARAEQLATAMAVTLSQPTVVAALEARGYMVRPMSGPQMRQLLQRDLANWRRLSLHSAPETTTGLPTAV